MRTVSVQQMPNGFEIDVPTFGQWFKAGVAFTLGAIVVTAAAALTWTVVGLSLVSTMARHMMR